MIYSYQNYFPRGLPNHYMFIYYSVITCYLYISCYLLWVNFVTSELMILIIYFTADASGSLYIILRSRKTQNAYVLVFGEAKSEWFYVRKNQDWRFNISSHPSASYIQHVVRVVNVCEWRGRHLWVPARARALYGLNEWLSEKYWNSRIPGISFVELV